MIYYGVCISKIYIYNIVCILYIYIYMYIVIYTHAHASARAYTCSAARRQRSRASRARSLVGQNVGVASGLVSLKRAYMPRNWTCKPCMCSRALGHKGLTSPRTGLTGALTRLVGPRATPARWPTSQRAHPSRPACPQLPTPALQALSPGIWGPPAPSASALSAHGGPQRQRGNTDPEFASYRSVNEV